jgi:hypothetical protein
MDLATIPQPSVLMQLNWQQQRLRQRLCRHSIVKPFTGSIARP